MDVAAVITFHRDDAFFPEALASVLAQTRPPDEIIVVDDASPPGTAETLRDLDPRVRIVRHDVNRGVAAARQTGADAAYAPLVAYLDAGDVWLPDKLERQTADLEAHTHLAANHTGIVLFRGEGDERVFADKPRELGLAEALRTRHVLGSALMIRRDVLRAAGGWTTDRRLNEDWELSIRLVAAGHRVGFLAEPLVQFRRFDHAGRRAQSRRLMRGNLAMLRMYGELYWKTLGLRGTIATYGDVIAGGGRYGGIDGRALRALGWLFGYRER